MTDIFALAMELGGAISGEHGVGRAKTGYFLELEDPVKISLMRRIKQSFDPAGILNPGVVFGTPEHGQEPAGPRPVIGRPNRPASLERNIFVDSSVRRSSKPISPHLSGQSDAASVTVIHPAFTRC